MLAYRLDTFKSSGSLIDIPEPAIDAHEIRVRVVAAGVNPVDWQIRTGEMPEAVLPRTLGEDFAGVVEAVGASVTRLHVGDRVCGSGNANGSFAELTVISQDSALCAIPDGLSEVTGAALPMPGLTALACVNAAKITAGTSVLIVGAAGSVGEIAVQLAMLRQAHVIAVVRDWGRDELEAIGAKHIIDSPDAATTVAAALAELSAGVEVLLDFASSPDELKVLAGALRPRGIVISTVFAVDETWMIQRGLRGVNFELGASGGGTSANLGELLGLVKQGKLEVRVAGRRRLADAGATLDAGLRGELHGKFVLMPQSHN